MCRRSAQISEIQPDTAKLHILAGENWLYSKWLLNELNPVEKYLVYALHLQDQVTARIRLPICITYTDRVSREIGIDTKYKEHLAGYGSFWRSSIRIEKFKALNIDHYNTETIDI